MKLAYVSRRIGWDGMDDVGIYVDMTIRSMAEAGHGVYLVTDADVGALGERDGLPAGVEVVSVKAVDPRLRYFTELHQYSDRVLHTLLELTQRVRLDGIEFSQDGGEGFSTIRAKRTLGQFPHTPIVVRLHAPRACVRDAVGYAPTDFHDEIRLYAEEYSIAHADHVVAPTASLARQVEQRWRRSAVVIPHPLGPEPASAVLETPQAHFDAVPELVFVGALSPAKGADLFLDVARRVLDREPAFRFRLLGPDTLTGPFRNSYRAHLERRLPSDLRLRTSFGPIPDWSCPLPPHSICLFPARWDDAPYALLLAMLMPRRRARELPHRRGRGPRRWRCRARHRSHRRGRDG